jgi:hydrogenase expression/formation protein HypE
LADPGDGPDAGERLQAWTCPAPLRDHERVILGHGGGGRLQAELLEHIVLPVLGGDALARLADAAVLDAGGARLALTTDAHVVHPLEFPGGDIGSLAVHGTVNDLAMMGARPLALTSALIIEEGLEVEVLGRILTSMGAAARNAGVAVVAGDTKVVERGSGDGLFITTAGVGLVAEGVEIGPERARPGDAVLVSGPVGDHGIAILSVREGLEFGGEILSDSAPLHGLVAAMLAAAPGAVRALRDPTRGGLASALNELALASGVAIELQERHPGSRDRRLRLGPPRPGPALRSL